MTIYTVENNHLSICFLLFPSQLLHLPHQQNQCAIILKMKNSKYFILIIKHFNMSLWQVKKHINGMPKFVWPARK